MRPRSSPPPDGNPHRRHWALEPGLVFLNHGSFGATPRPVLEAQDAWRARMESNPVRFLGRELEEALDRARLRLADFVGADAEGIAFVANATTGVNTALRSLALGPCDEILLTDHGYNACRNAALAVAGATSATVVEARLPFPLEDPSDITDAVLARLGPRTRVAVVDHVTSPTGLVLPVTELVRELAGRGVTVIVDGAHAPGMVGLRLDELGADFYAANCHKWLCAPKGSAFLWVADHRRSRTHPLVISHGANAPCDRRSRFRLEFDWTGTSDPSPWLSVPAAIDFLGGLLPGGWPELEERNRRLALAARELLCRTLGIVPPAPEKMIGTLVALPLPGSGSTPPARPDVVDPLQRALFQRHRIEVPVVPWRPDGARLLRVSAHVYNDLSEYQALADALAAEGVTRSR